MKAVTILGGAGFVGANLAHRLLMSGEPVELFDNLSRAGVERNVEWLRDQHDGLFGFTIGDIRDQDALNESLANASHVYHLAAQVALSHSVRDPVFDFEVNARGTLNVLEALRRLENPPPLCYASTHQVYGALADIPLLERPTRYDPVDRRLLASGFSEALPLEFHSPHGCSKGAADQYVLDYARTFGLPAVVLRLGCIYGPRQYGNEGQGWVLHISKRCLAGDPVTIHGTGKQVRDLLFVDDLVDALLLARSHMADITGQAYNIGGGPQNTSSMLELLEALEELSGRRPSVGFVPETAGEQRYYVSDTRRFAGATGWAPHTDVEEGLRELYLWLSLPYEKRRTAFAAMETRL